MRTLAMLAAGLVGVLLLACGSDRTVESGAPIPATTAPGPATTETSTPEAQADELAASTVTTDPAVRIPTTTTTVAGFFERESLRWPEFTQDTAPVWPFHGLVQLWYEGYQQRQNQLQPIWMLRYWSLDPDAQTHSQVLLPDLKISCLGQIALVVHGELGVEIGGSPETGNSAYWVDWAGEARPVEPSEALLDSIAQRGSNVDVETEGDLVHITSGSQTRTYTMRDPLRPEGQRWNVQAQHSGDMFLLTVHPAHLECFTGVSWLSSADTGEIITCGANTTATSFVTPEPPTTQLVLPNPEQIRTYLSCPGRLDPTRVLFPYHN